MPKQSKKILIIDDDPAVRKVLTQKLKSGGFEIASAPNGKEGLKMIKREEPDLILLDIIMPELDGVSVLKVLKKRKETDKIPVIILTNLIDKEAFEISIKSGVTDYLIKANYSLEELLKKIKQKLY